MSKSFLFVGCLFSTSLLLTGGSPVATRPSRSFSGESGGMPQSPASPAQRRLRMPTASYSLLSLSDLESDILELTPVIVGQRVVLRELCQSGVSESEWIEAFDPRTRESFWASPEERTDEKVVEWLTETIQVLSNDVDRRLVYYLICDSETCQLIGLVGIRRRSFYGNIRIWITGNQNNRFRGSGRAQEAILLALKEYIQKRPNSLAYRQGFFWGSFSDNLISQIVAVKLGFEHITNQKITEYPGETIEEFCASKETIESMYEAYLSAITSGVDVSSFFRQIGDENKQAHAELCSFKDSCRVLNPHAHTEGVPRSSSHLNL